MRTAEPTEDGTRRDGSGAAASLWLLIASLVIATILDASPRAMATAYPIAAGVATLALWRTGGGERMLACLRRSGPLLAIIAFGAYALSSVLWTADVRESISKPLYLLAITVLSLGTIGFWRELEPPTRQRAARIAAITLAFALALGAIEAATNKLLMRTLFTAFPVLYRGLEDHVQQVGGVVVLISDTNIKRRVAMLALTVWPLLLLIVGLVPDGRRRWIATSVVAALTLTMIYVGPHQTSQLAGIASVATFVAATLAPAATRKILALVLVAWTLLAPPLAWAVANANLHEKSWVPTTARHRFVIWRATADEVMKAPVLGVGANATRKIFEATEKSREEKRDGGFVVGLTRHAHNAYLQIWYELGAVGAALFALVWWACVMGTSRLSRRVQPFALAHIATTAALVTSSYGIWQMWFLASIAFGAVALLCAAAFDRSREPAHDGERPSRPQPSRPLPSGETPVA